MNIQLVMSGLDQIQRNTKAFVLTIDSTKQREAMNALRMGWIRLGQGMWDLSDEQMAEVVNLMNSFWRSNEAGPAVEVER